jgi:hypothetical protein
MLRQIANVIMTCLLLVSTTGFAVSEHYCGNHLVSVKLDTQPQACCDGGMCCYTETSFYKLDDNFLASYTQINLESRFCVNLLLPSTYVEVPQPENSYFLSITFPGPPPLSMQSRLAVQQVYRL